MNLLPAFPLRSFWLLLLGSMTFAQGAERHRYTFNDGTADDSIGSADAVLVGVTGVISAGRLDLAGNTAESSNDAATIAGTGGSFLDLPNGLISAAASSGTSGAITVEFWAVAETNRTWAALASFGTSDGGENSSPGGGGTDYFQIIPSAGGVNVFRSDMHPAGASSVVVDGTSELSTTDSQHVAIVVDQSGGLPGTMTLYIDGTLKGSVAAGNFDLTSFTNNNNWLGRSQYNDPLFDGTVDEFRIHDTPLDHPAVLNSYHAGPTPDPDRDEDGLPDFLENNSGIYNGPTNPGTDPDKDDTDGDGVKDGIEVNNGSDPVDPLSTPPPPPGGGGLAGPEPVGPYFNGIFPAAAPGANGEFLTTIAFPNLSFNQPMYLTAVPGTTRMAVVEKDGRIRTFENDPDTSSSSLLLDLGGGPSSGGSLYNNSDSGMTGIAFHPEFRQSGSSNREYIYVTYKWRPASGGTSGDHAYWRLSRFNVPFGTLDADESSELILVQQFDQQMWHDAGCVIFGQDGYLYFSIGDEGGANDPYNVTQQLNHRLFSGIFRVDVDQGAGSHPIRRQPLARHPAQAASWPDSFTQGYSIPADNPFLDPAGSLLEEYWCLGLRNTFRFYEDPGTGLMWGGDVGQSAREEFNVLVAGANYGWAYREGTIAGPKATPGTILGTEMEPLWDYDGSLGHCALGGAVYRGTEHPDLFGKHLFLDNVSQRVWAITTTGTTLEKVEQITTMPGSGFFSGPTSVGADHNGELYITKLEGGRIYKLARSGSTVPEPPLLLSQTGIFSNLSTLEPSAGVFPYTVNSPLWSDGSAKQRWISIPNDGFHNTPGEQIGFSANGNWTFPPGTVLVKHFELTTDENNPGSPTRLETRFLIITDDDAPYGVTYKWLPDGSDAQLLTTGESEDYTITLADGESTVQTWDFPSRNQCMECHTAAAGRVLGPRTHQLHGDNFYPRTGLIDNQLRTMYGLGWFDDAYHDDLLDYYLKAAPLGDTGTPLETRVRSYLDSNCSHCHQPGGARAFFDARFTTPLHEQSLLHGKLYGSFLGGGEATVVPGNAALSTVPHRMNLVGPDQMPPLARNVVDHTAVQEVSSWINSLLARPGVALSAPAAATGPFTVTVETTTALSGLAANDFAVGNGLTTSLTPHANPLLHTLAVTPSLSGPVTVSLPANKAVDGTGLGNYPSNLTITNIVDPSLVTHLAFEDGNGTIATDRSGQNNNATLVNMGANSWVPGSCETGLEFDGVNDHLTLSRPVSGDFTLAVWIKTTQSFNSSSHGPASTHILNCDAPGVADDFVLAGSQSEGGINHATFFTGNPQINILGTSSINSGDWIHLAATREQATGTMKLYVDGFLEATTTGANSGPLDAQSTITIGGTNAFAGTMDEIRIYDRALDQNEITFLQQCSLPDPPYEQFIEAHLPGIAHLHDPSLDIDGDGLNNFMEWAFDLSPIETDSSPTTSGINGSGQFTLTFPRLQSDDGPDYELMVSEDVLNWFPAGLDAEEVSVTDLPGPTESVTIRYAGPLGQSTNRLFGRLRISD